MGLSEIKKIKKEEDRFIILIDDLRELNLLDGLSLDKDDGEEEIPPDENVELIPAPSSLSTEGLNATPGLSDTDIQNIAERVVAMLSDKTIRDIAWEVIPVVAEEIVRGRIRQLENEEVE